MVNKWNIYWLIFLRFSRVLGVITSAPEHKQLLISIIYNIIINLPTTESFKINRYMVHFIYMVSATLWYLQNISNGVTTVLHKVVNTIPVINHTSKSFLNFPTKDISKLFHHFIMILSEGVNKVHYYPSYYLQALEWGLYSQEVGNWLQNHERRSQQGTAHRMLNPKINLVIT